MNITLLFGTETGNSEMLCEDIESEFEGDHDFTISSLADVDPAAMETNTFHVVVCSSYGDGELPASAQPFADKVEKTKPDLTGLRFAIFGLGDSDYETFGEGSHQLADLLVAAGATQIGPRIVHDVQSGDLAEDVAYPWFTERVAEAEAAMEDA
ncbi:flavodoxin domain-containing protein [Mesobacterium pallidum]|uniref:flavodoxin domain-containing protein n=1 Tax=Mesobacterium pallidum TaxID=2872037 RepID=UPI001EE1AF1E|nr:flavodoxin domain-containing protein [Mesobacterium pallidum]